MVIIGPQLIIDVFLLHILEIQQGYKIYDYFTFSAYRFEIRTKKWVTQNYLDRSIIHSFRSLDGMNFSSQFYFICCLTTWGIVFLYLGFTAIIRNEYNAYADPVNMALVALVAAFAIPCRAMLSIATTKTNLWKITGDDRLRTEFGLVNRINMRIK